jgi:hypothetical protein
MYSLARRLRRVPHMPLTRRNRARPTLALRSRRPTEAAELLHACRSPPLPSRHHRVILEASHASHSKVLAEAQQRRAYRGKAGIVSIFGTKLRRFLNGSFSAGAALALYAASGVILCISLYECDRRDGTLTASASGCLLFAVLSIVPSFCFLLIGWGAYFSLVRAKRVGSALAANALELAQIVVLATAVPLVFFCFVGQAPAVPVVLSQGAKLIRGPMWRVTLDRKALIVTGEFTPGIAAAVEQSIAASPSVRIVVFESPGGDINEAMRIGRAIRQNGLETGVATECSSACTYSFIAGRERILLPSGRLGFHACRKVVWYSSCENKKYSSYLIVGGLDETFIRKALNVQPPDIWYPTPAELLAAHVVTRTQPDGSGNRNQY